MTEIPFSLLDFRENLAFAVTRYGNLICLKHDYGVSQMLLQYGEYFEGEITLFKQLIKPGMVVVEAGSNIGAHTVPIAKLVGSKGKVLAFEPQFVVFKILEANLIMNQIENAHAYHAALGSEAGMLNIAPVDYTQDDNFGGIALTKGVGDSVAVTTLDSYNLPRLDFLKIDVEGMEIEVLKGSYKSIAAFRPIIYVENDRLEPGSSEALNKYILGMDYRAWWHITPAFDINNYLGNAINHYPHGASANMLCAPKEMSFSVNLPEMVDVEQTWLHVLQHYAENTP